MYTITNTIIINCIRITITSDEREYRQLSLNSSNLL